jgi:CHAD domain-containing protein
MGSVSDEDVSFDEAGSAVLAALAVIVVRFDAAERATIGDEADAVHQARILVRRMRSILAVFGPLFDDARVRRLRSALAELGDELGSARDVEVRLEHAERHLEGTASREVRARLIDAEREQYRRLHGELVAFLNDAGDERRRRLEDFIVDPQFSALATKAARSELARLLERQCRRVWKAASAATGDLESLHRLRRAARRLRYACEAVSDEPSAVFGDDVRALAGAAQGVQDVLGDHRDELLFAMQVRRAGTMAREAGEPDSSYAVIAEDAFAAAATRLEELPSALQALRKHARVLRTIG